MAEFVSSCEVANEFVASAEDNDGKKREEERNWASDVPFSENLIELSDSIIFVIYIGS